MNFIALCTIVFAPITILANQIKRVKDGFKVENGLDRFDKPISLFEGDIFQTKISSTDSDGDSYVYESLRNKKGGPPLHFHYAQDEWWYVLEGEFLIQVGDKKFTTQKGDTVYGPRMVPHTFSKINEGPSRLLMGFHPAGKMEEYFIEASKGTVSKMTEAEKIIYKKSMGFEVIGAALIYNKNN